MDIDIKDRLINVFHELEKINKSNVFRKKKQEIKKIDTIQPFQENGNINYEKEVHAFEKESLVYLPTITLPLKVLRIINLGASYLTVISNEGEPIFHTFYSPKGSNHILIPINSGIDIFFIEKGSGEKLWIAK